MADAQVDMINQNGTGMGDVASRLLASNFNVNALRTQTTLRKDEWLQFDNKVIEVAKSRLIGISDLVSKGLTYNLPNALGKTRLEWERVGDMDPAEVSMAGVSTGQNDRVNYDLASMPIPIVHKEFQINIRALYASRNNDESLDTVQAGMAARKVAETLESILYLGSTALGSNSALYGYTTAPNRNTAAVTADWSSTTGANIVTDVIRMINIMNSDNMYGPFTIYVPLAAYVNMGNDYKAASDKTIMERVKAIPGIADVRPAEKLTGTNVVMVQMTSDVIDLIDGLQPTTVQWSSGDGFIQHFKVIAIMPPRIKADQLGQSGIVHFS